MYDLDIHEAAMGKTLAEIIDVGRTLYTESQLIGEAADLLLQLIETEPIPTDHLVVELVKSIRDTAGYCCRIMEGPR